MEAASADEFSPSLEEETPGPKASPPLVSIFPGVALDIPVVEEDPEIPIVEEDPAVSPGTRPTSPSLHSPDFSPPEESSPSPFVAAPSGMEVERALRPAPVFAEDSEEDWGTWSAGEKGPKRPRGPSESIPAPRVGLPSNISGGSLRPPVGGLSNEEQLLIRSLRFEAARRWEEAEATGFARANVAPSEPFPLLSHVHGVPPVETMWDSVSAALMIPGHLVRALGNPAVDIGAGPSGPPAMAAPLEWEPPTPVIREISKAAFPERPKVRPLMVEASTQTTEGQEEWQRWLDRTLQGKGLAEFGLCGRDFKFALELAEEHPNQPRARQAAWRDRRDQANYVSVIQYLFYAQRCYRSFRRTPEGYTGLVGGFSSRQLVRPTGCFALEERAAWDLLETALYKRMSNVRRRQEEKASRSEMRAAIRSSRAKAAPGPPRLPSSSASSSSSEDFAMGRGEIEALGRVKATPNFGDYQVWATMESMVGYSLAKMANYVPAPAGESGPAPKSPGAASSCAGSVAPGMVIASYFQLPRVPVPSANPPGNLAKDADIYKRHGVAPPPAVPPRSRLPTPPRAKEPPMASGVPATGQTGRERAFTLSSPSATPAAPSTAPLGQAYEDYEAAAEFSQFASQARQVIEEGRRLLGERPSSAPN